MTFSFQDVYPTMPSNQLPTTSQTIPDSEEQSRYVDSIENEAGMKRKPQEPHLIFGALAVLIIVMIILHFLG